MIAIIPLARGIFGMAAQMQAAAGENGHREALR
jgi:hypothetical protein